MKSLVLNKLVVEMAKMVEQQSHRIITIQADATPIQVRADGHCLKQVLLNLIDHSQHQRRAIR